MLNLIRGEKLFFVVSVQLFLVLIAGCGQENKPQDSPEVGLHEELPESRIKKDTENLFNVLSIEGSFDEGAIVFDESNSAYLHYENPMARFRAKVQCNTTEKDVWKIGFMQILVENTIQYTYMGNNYTEWAINVPVNDSDGSEYPWYDGTNGYAKGEGIANLYFDDNFPANVGWRQVLPEDMSVERTDEELSKVERNQRFVAFLLAFNGMDSTYRVIKQIDWTYSFAAEVDCSKPRGSRCTLLFENKPNPVIKDDVDEQYFNMKYFSAPSANGSQRFISHIE